MTTTVTPLRQDSLDFLAWNAYMGNSAKAVLDALMDWTDGPAEGRPVVSLNEAMRHHQTVREFAQRRDYRLLAEQPESRDQDPMPEEGNTVVLVPRRRGLEVVRWQVKPMGTRWEVTSHDQVHDPRRHLRFVLRTPGGLWKCTADHWPTNGLDGPNAPAVRECVQFTRAALEHRPRAVAVSVGDKNMGLTALRDLFPDAEVRGHAPDALLADGASRVTMLGTMGKRGSDHQGVLYRVTR